MTSLSILSRWVPGLLALDGSIYVADKKQGSSKTNSSKHQEEAIADTSHVAEEK